MNREEMILQLKNGKHPIDVSLQKWIDISSVPSVNRLKARHQYDEGKNNCALCYNLETCDECIIFVAYKVRCDESDGINDKKYKHDFYAQYRTTGNAQIMIDALNKIKKNLRWILFKHSIKLSLSSFISFIKKSIRKLLVSLKLKSNV